MNYTAPSQPSPARGRGLLASRPLRPGDIIVVFNGTPSIAIPDSNHLDDTCSYCLVVPFASSTAHPSDDAGSDITSPSPPVKLRACTACRAVSYCSQTCQKRDWQHIHKLECKVFQRVRASASSSGHTALPTPSRALVQVLLIGSRSEAEGQALAGELESHVDEFRRQPAGNVNDNSRASAQAASWQDMEIQAMAAMHYLGRKAQSDEREKNRAMEILCKLQVNSFNRLDADVEQTGLYLHPQLAMVNHSCLPNAYVQFSGRVAVLRASQSIEEGQEVEISYIDQALPLSQRHSALKARYHFTCACPRCAGNLDVYQACRLYPDLHLNDLSLANDLATILKQHTPSPSQQTSQIQQSYLTTLGPIRSSTTTTQDLRRRWLLCRPLVSSPTAAAAAERPWATHPLPEILTEALIHLSSASRYTSALPLSALLAAHTEPVRSPFPESPGRVKGLLTLAKLLANAAAPPPPPQQQQQRQQQQLSSTPSSSSTAAAKTKSSIRAVLATLDVPTTCEVLLRLVLRSAAPPPSTSSSSDQQQQQQRYLLQPYHREAQEMLADISSLPGRDDERSSVQKLFRSHSALDNGGGIQGASRQEREKSRLFLDMVIAKPLREIASFAMAVIDAEFGGGGGGDSGGGSGYDVVGGIGDQVD